MPETLHHSPILSFKLLLVERLCFGENVGLNYLTFFVVEKTRFLSALDSQMLEINKYFKNTKAKLCSALDQI